MMNSAAVIGRQLRQQAVAGRSSGPLVQAPPVYGKNRPCTPSHVLLPNRPYSPAPPPSSLADYAPMFANRAAYTTADRMQVFCSAPYTSIPTGNPLAVQRDQRELAAQLRKSELARTQPKLRCTWHCFCVAFKALSGGIVLLTIGTVMSVVGFLAEARLNASKEQKMAAGKVTMETTGGLSTSPTESPEDMHARIRNLTFAGPVIMGLGGIVIVAALVLTFEVRDTLGIKQRPEDPMPASRTKRLASIACGLPAESDNQKKYINNRSDSFSRHVRREANHSVGEHEYANKNGAAIRKGSSRRSNSSRSKRRRKTIEATDNDNNDVNDNSKQLDHLDSNTNDIELKDIDKGQMSRSRSHSKGHHRVHHHAQRSSVTSKKHAPTLDTLNVEHLMTMDQSQCDTNESHATSDNAYEMCTDNHQHVLDLPNTPSIDYCNQPPVMQHLKVSTHALQSTKRTLSHTFSIDSSDCPSFGRPLCMSGPNSPPDTELSDADGCSIIQSHQWRPSRCSCSASPTRILADEHVLPSDGSDTEHEAGLSVGQPALTGNTNYGYSMSVSDSANTISGPADCLVPCAPDAPLVNAKMQSFQPDLNWNLRLLEQQQLILQQQRLLQQQQQQLDRLLQQQNQQQPQQQSQQQPQQQLQQQPQQLQNQQMQVKQSQTEIIDCLIDSNVIVNVSTKKLETTSRNFVSETTIVGNPGVECNTSWSQRSRQNSLGGLVNRLEAGLLSIAKNKSKTIASMESDGLSSSCSSLTSSCGNRRSRSGSKSRSQLIRSLLMGSAAASDSSSALNSSSHFHIDSTDPKKPLLFDDNNNQNQSQDIKCSSESAIELTDISKSAQFN